jgi:hypothetical protein
MEELLELFFSPPLATARLGGSDIPLESFRWSDNPTVRGAGRTVIEPAPSLRIETDGTPTVYMPFEIRFRDGELLRPVAPFFELWVTLQRADRTLTYQEPLTLDVLQRLGVSLDSIQYRISVANRKAERRTHSPACSFVARAEAVGSDHRRKPLLASSPHNPGDIPLVRPDRPISLGCFQVVRPLSNVSLGVDLSILRVRFTPGRGEVYGPPNAILGMAKPLQEGRVLSPKVLQGRMYELVPPANRILNPDTAWSRYVLYKSGQVDPQPCDTYDGAAVGDDRSWGIVDDTCDGVIEASIVVSGKRLRGVARVLVCPPDFSPDRRPFASLADDLADRDLSAAEVKENTIEEAEEEIADLFQRVFETASQTNLDLERWRAVGRQGGTNYPELPQIDHRSMTAEDKPYADITTVLPDEPDQTEAGEATADLPLPYTLVAHDVHAVFTDIDTLLDTIRTKADHLRQLIRPPFGHLKELEQWPSPQPNSSFRDPRVIRDTLQDMRMPPYLIDSDQNPLSLTWRQYHLLMDVINFLTPENETVRNSRARDVRHVAAVLQAIDQAVQNRIKGA